MESAALVAPLTHHPFVSKSQAPSGWNLLQQVAPLTHRAPVTHHRTVVGTCHWWVTGRRPNSLEYQICTAPEPFDTLVTGLGFPSILTLSNSGAGSTSGSTTLQTDPGTNRRPAPHARSSVPAAGAGALFFTAFSMGKSLDRKGGNVKKGDK